MSDNIKELGYGCYYKALKPIIFECGTGGGFSYATAGSSMSLTSPNQGGVPKTVGSVTIDTSELTRPKTKIDFTANIHFASKDPSATVQLEFQLYRNCGNRGEEPLGSWYYEISNESDNFAETFTFFWCDCNSCPGCCLYTVRCKPMSIEDAAISVNECHITAIAQSGI